MFLADCNFAFFRKPKTGRMLLASVLFVLTACEAAFEGQPRDVLNPDRPALTDVVLDARLSRGSVVSAIDNGSPSARNQIVLARMTEIDLLYSDYETRLLAESRQSGFAFSLVGVLTGLAGGNASAATSKTLSLVGAGISGLQTSYEKEVLAERTINAFIAQMRASRATVRSEIYSKLGSSDVSRYSIEASLSDLERYRQAGTLATAIVGITEQAVDNQQIQEQAARSSENTFFLTGVDRRQGPATTEPVIAVSVQERMRALGKEVSDGSIPAEKLVALLNNPDLPDSAISDNITKLRTTITKGPLITTDALENEQTNVFLRNAIEGIIQPIERVEIADKLESILR